jgi:hypothetical protein
MAASVNGKIYLIGGQLNADDPPNTNSYVNTVYELDPAVGVWVTKVPMPTARSSGVAVVRDGKIYVAGGRLPRGSDFAVYDPAADTWEVLPNLPTQRNHFTGAAIYGRIPLRRRAARQWIVAPHDDRARSFRPSNADLDDRRPHAAPPQRHERGHGPRFVPRLGRRGAGRHVPRP